MNEIQLQLIWYLFFTGFVLTGIGMLYPLTALKTLDLRLFYFLYSKLSGNARVFRVLWPYGKTGFMVGALGIFLLLNWYSGCCAIFCFIIIACVERLIKLTMKRKRPFVLLSEVEILQPHKPEDFSHPSGDAMRIWYLTFIIPSVFGWSFLLLSVFLSVAVLVSFGRIAFAVHFPLDVAGGVGLALLGAGFFYLMVSI
ncbi:MAG: phosphatase PAP2 family protein [Thermodesulfobacteriota bacterium]